MFVFLIVAVIGSGVGFLWGNGLPWWYLSVIAFFAAWITTRRSSRSLLGGFVAGWLVWLVFSLIYLAGDEGNLGTKMAQVLPLGGNSLLLVLAGSLVGGLCTGLAAWAGGVVRWAMLGKQPAANGSTVS